MLNHFDINNYNPITTVRIRIIFLLNNTGAVVPFHHQHLIAESLDRIIKRLPVEFQGNSFFTFSGLKGETKVGKKGLHFFSMKITLVFASNNEEFLEALINELFRHEEIEIGELKLSPDSVIREEPPASKLFSLQGTSQKRKYVCISPLVLLRPEEDGAKQFISPETDLFSDLLYESTMIRMEKSKKYTMEQIDSFFKFQVVPDKDYLDRIKSEEKKFARIYTIPNPHVENPATMVEIRGYTMPFTLYAAPEVHDFVFNCGLGELTYRGYGMLDMPDNNFSKRTSNDVIRQRESPLVSRIPGGHEEDI